jgi:hypothetical protein
LSQKIEINLKCPELKDLGLCRLIAVPLYQQAFANGMTQRVKCFFLKLTIIDLSDNLMDAIFIQYATRRQAHKSNDWNC